MVGSRFGNEHGKVKIGCLVSALVFIAGAYFGIAFFRVRFRFYQIQDYVTEQANFASAIDDNTIRQRLVERADQLDLPLGPRAWTIRRSRDRSQNRRFITISAQYVDSVVVKVGGLRKVWRFTFKPGVENEQF